MFQTKLVYIYILRFSIGKVVNKLCHVHIAHTRLNSNAIEDESKPFACPIASFNLRCRREGWLTRHIEECHQASEEASTPAPKPTTPATETKTRMPATTTTSEFKCPRCARTLLKRKGMILHCYSKHRFSETKGMFMKEITSRTTAKSSEFWSGPRGSGLQ